ncbi:1-aminocyclopropane-1-carboxylate deaminase/D-cysteine desulfhydrase [Undibacterium sp. Di24W]|uniref:1-aminocyclopropane-1-carboxylate deaminase/D-cysteine desulfhydrase n=1 Tax=Undibacterium sp. Di24W TaxID=3413033 RepID=UPI003BF288E2
MPLLSFSSPLEPLLNDIFPNIQLWMKRDDLLHPSVSGNKFRKLKYNLIQASKNRPILISMGGAWSNHLHALAHAAQLLGLSSVGLVRGLHAEHSALNATLSDCQSAGMQLQFVSREDYRKLRDQPDIWKNWVTQDPKEYLWLPEGGSNALALTGMAELVDELKQDLGRTPDTIVLACGTGASLAGILAGLRGQGRVIGIAAVSNAGYLRQQVQQLLLDAGQPAYQNFEILLDFAQGGFAKASPALLQFCEQFFQQTKIPVEPVYTGKMLFALAELCRSGKFVKGERVVAIHTGGLQGLRGYLTK